MRISNVLLALGVGSATIALPARVPAQVNISINLGRQLGPEISIFAYSEPVYGDWHTSYLLWTPVTIYEYQGHYYRRSVQGTRPIIVYSRGGEYFLPPPDRGWVGYDKRYDYRRVPDDRDRGRAKFKGKDNGNGKGNGKDNGRGRGRGRGNDNW